MKIERRLIVCNKGSFWGGAHTEWSTDPEDPDAIAFREKYSNLACYDHCPTSHYDWDIHQRHLIVEERPAPRWWSRLRSRLSKGEPSE